MRKVIRMIVWVAIIALGLVSCAPETTVSKKTDLPYVVTTLFPQYDFVRQIAGPYVEVVLMVPPGVEPHAYEPTPRDMVGLEDAQAFIFTGELMEPWAKKVIAAVKSDQLLVVDLSEGLTLLETSEDHGGHDEDDDGEDHEEEDHHEDPHIWLDPLNAKKMVEDIIETLVEIAPEHEAVFRDKGQTYLASLDQFHQDALAMVEQAKVKTIVSGGHFAFGYFANRYGLTFLSPYIGFSPDAEPTPQSIAKLIEWLKANQVHYIYHEELVDPKVATIISEETDAKLLELHAAHSLSKEDFESGVTYLEIMYRNLEQLSRGLASDWVKDHE